MSLRRQSRRERRYLSAKDWPSTEEIDGFTYGPGPDPADARWASDSFNQGDDGHTTDFPPDDVLDQLAGEAEAISRHERGLL